MGRASRHQERQAHHRPPPPSPGRSPRPPPSRTIRADDAILADTAAPAGDALLDWWNGDWYGWWTMYGCYGYV